jgi:gliding motility-associated-like protein/uncharacterized repeat protein (TIGR01451 family)
MGRQVLYRIQKAMAMKNLWIPTFLLIILSAGFLVSFSPVNPFDEVDNHSDIPHKEGVDSINNVIDYIPAGLALQGTDWNLQPSVGSTITTITSITTGQSQFVDITFLGNPDFQGIVKNCSEITDANTLMGFISTDVDSTSGGNPNKDGKEVDADLEPLQVEVFDLALRKMINNAQTDNPLVAGRFVTFDIEVFNQGTINAQQIEVIDYIPTGLTLADNTWTSADTTATYNTNLNINAGQSQTVTIRFSVDDFIEGNLTNFAEITSAQDNLGDNVPDIDSSPDDTLGNDTNVDDEINNGGGDEDDFDEAVVSIQRFDLAIIKSLDQQTTQMPILQGRLVTFNLTVFNQGTLAATGIRLVDYVPVGLTLEDPNWTQTGNMASLNSPFVLGPGMISFLSITFRVDTGVTGVLVNRTEIQDALDEFGTPIEDFDSTPDAIVGNDPGGEVGTSNDDFIDGNGKQGEDEDDVDPAQIEVKIFDLALRKTFSAADSEMPILSGQIVTFNIEVFNQGNVNATGVGIVDYIPSGLTLEDGAWTQNGDLAVHNQLLTLGVGQSQTITITFRVNEGFVGSTTNFAEISGAADESGDPADDIDSTPDNENDDPEEEDDHDDEVIEAEIFDLALRKSTDFTATISADTDVLFAIEIINQGTVTATNFDVIDYIPTGFELSVNDNNGWTNNGTTATQTIAGPLPADASTSVEILLHVLPTITAGTYENNAEITAASDENGLPANDIDSTPDTMNEDPVVDNEIDPNPNDEDDHDVETIAVCDIIPPTITGIPTDLTIDCSETVPAAPELYTGIIVDDESDPDGVVLTFIEMSTQGEGDACSAYSYEITRTWTATDICDNQTTLTQVITVMDENAPDIEVDAQDKTIECSDNNEAAYQAWLATNGNAVAEDNCSPITWTNELLDETDDCGPTFEREVEFVVTDICGNESSTTATFNVIDTTDPVLTNIPADMSTECDEALPTDAPTATDNCDNDATITLSENEIAGDCENNYTILRAWTAKDDCGNTSTGVQEITVTDTQAPVITQVPVDVDTNCQGLQILPTAGMPLVTDNCDANVTIVLDENTEQTLCETIITRTWTATDNCGNVSTATQTVTAIDNDAPEFINGPFDLESSCGVNNQGTIQAWLLTNGGGGQAYDACGDVIWSNDYDGTIPMCGEVEVTFTITDACGNLAIATVTLTIEDTEAPTILSIPFDVSIECGSDMPPVPTPLVQDNCNDDVEAVYTETVDMTDCETIYTRTWTAEDDCGNVAAKTQIITITDSTSPQISGIPFDLTISVGNVLPDPGNVNFNDNCDTDIDLQFNEVLTTTDEDCGGLILRTWIATDNCGNTAVGTQEIVIEGDIFLATIISNSPICEVETLEIEVNGGSSWSWAGPNNFTANTQTIAISNAQDGIHNGIYNVTVTGDSGCAALLSANVEILDYPEIEVNMTNATCEEGGNIAINVTAGTDLMFNWSDLMGGNNLQNRTGLAEGIYNVTVTNDAGCSVTSGDITIVDTCNPDCETPTTSAQVSNVMCDEAGSIMLTVSGGVASYNFEWGDLAGIANPQNRFDLAAGTYSVTVTESEGCTMVLNGLMVEDICDPNCTAPVITGVAITNSICGEGDGTALISVDGNLNDYTFAWSNNALTVNAVTSLAAGMYSVTVGNATDVTCFTVMDITIEDENGPSTSIMSIGAADCDAPNGSAILSPASFNFVWSDGGTSAVRDDLSKGDYTVMVTDPSTGCVSTLAINIPVDNPLTVGLGVTDKECDNDGGSIMLTIGGGSETYIYNWTDLVGTDNPKDRFNLDEGAFEVKITDAVYNCVADLSNILIKDNCENPVDTCIAPIITTVDVTDANCSDADGSGTLIIDGNPADYVYTWIPDLGTPTSAGEGRTGLTAGAYTVFVLQPDDANCYTKIVFEIEALDGPSLTNITLVPATCDNPLGGATLYPANLNYLWLHDDIVAQTRDDLVADVYTIEMSDSANPDCPTIIQLQIQQDGTFTVDAQVVIEPDCAAANGQVDVSVNTNGSFTYNWNDGGTGESRSDLADGLYTVSVANTDCEIAVEVTLEDDCTDPQILETVSVTATKTQPNGNNNRDNESGSHGKDRDSEVPSCLNDAVQTVMNQLVHLYPMDNDEMNGEMLDFGIETPATYGEVGLFGQRFVYVPETDVCGETDQFTYYVTNGMGTSTAMVEVQILCDDLVVYSGFSPNGDGVNDNFVIEGIDKYSENQVLIFNRWGSEVYRKGGYDNNDPWGGEFKGELVPQGTYFYVIDDGEGRKYSGYVEVVR